MVSKERSEEERGENESRRRRRFVLFLAFPSFPQLPHKNEKQRTAGLVDFACDSLRPVAALAAGAGAAAGFFVVDDCDSLRPAFFASPGASGFLFSEAAGFLEPGTSAALGLRVAGTSAGPTTSSAFLEDCWVSSRAWAAGIEVDFFYFGGEGEKMSAGKKRKKRARAPELRAKKRRERERKRAAGSKKEAELSQTKGEREERALQRKYQTCSHLAGPPSQLRADFAR